MMSPQGLLQMRQKALEIECSRREMIPDEACENE